MADGPSIEFGKRITQYRVLKGWSVSEAARQMSVPRTSLSRWEHGHEMPCGDNMIRLHDHLGMPISSLPSGGGASQSPIEVGWQLVLPFDQPANCEIRAIRRGPTSVQIEFRVRGLAG